MPRFALFRLYDPHAAMVVGAPSVNLVFRCRSAGTCTCGMRALACQPVMLPSKAALAPRDDCTSNCDLDLMYACKHGPEGKRAAALYDIAQG